jgi:hypothetical protein
MTLKTQPAHIRWALYLKSGPVEIWEGKPARGNYSQWEVRNAQSGETRPVDKNTVMTTFDQMLTNAES